ncbi:hypothetical protein AKJ09_09043 [Labilithrix luteola]|uniref:Uncharacterized protein n=1 Tax=Labilithrix luteola TaxID=1391654 RepID=A0A0K1QAD7_9BACT|nr:hypothetical protein [Labilithrix luteola]AKV02380.1 hypothetical protein AKJ09_09043 [Labilithrix luteola]
MAENGDERVTGPSLFERAKSWGATVAAVLVVTNIVVAAAWFVYMYLVPTPAREQLATTHGDLVGIWSGASFRLEIRPDGTVSVNKDLTHYGGKIWRFHERDFSLWVFPVFPAHFHIDAMPERRASGEEWLVVDGYHLQRARL